MIDLTTRARWRLWVSHWNHGNVLNSKHRIRQILQTPQTRTNSFPSHILEEPYRSWEDIDETPWNQQLTPKHGQELLTSENKGTILETILLHPRSLVKQEDTKMCHPFFQNKLYKLLTDIIFQIFTEIHLKRKIPGSINQPRCLPNYQPRRPPNLQLRRLLNFWQEIRTLRSTIRTTWSTYDGSISSPALETCHSLTSKECQSEPTPSMCSTHWRTPSRRGQRSSGRW